MLNIAVGANKERHLHTTISIRFVYLRFDVNVELKIAKNDIFYFLAKVRAMQFFFHVV